MKIEVQKLLLMKNFFKIITENNNSISFTLEQSSIKMLNNIYYNWLKSIYTKTHKHFPVHLKPVKIDIEKNQLPMGYINHKLPNYSDRTLEYKTCESTLSVRSELQCNVIVPTEDKMQYFFQWQRYRKYWWSSITTTPSLFSISDMDQDGDDKAKVNILAQTPCGPHVVETVAFDSSPNDYTHLTCSMALEDGLFTLLLDSMNHEEKDIYLRFHRTMAPYKISFAVFCEEPKQHSSLCELAELLHSKLLSNNISALLSDFTLPFSEQVKNHLQMGVVYTAILSESTLTDGIFHLRNSCTTLKEQVHVADFVEYSNLIFRKR